MMEQSLMDLIECYPSVKYWADSLTCREITKRGYLLHFRKFCRWLKKTPEQLVAERREELESDDPTMIHAFVTVDGCTFPSNPAFSRPQSAPCTVFTLSPAYCCSHSRSAIKDPRTS